MTLVPLGGAERHWFFPNVFQKSSKVHLRPPGIVRRDRRKNRRYDHDER